MNRLWIAAIATVLACSTAGPGQAGPARLAGVTDAGIVLRHGDQPYDRYGAREAIVFADPAQPGRLLMHYDGAGEQGWLAAAAESLDSGQTWGKLGLRLQLGAAGRPDSASASSPWVKRGIDGWWRMYYLGTSRASSPPNRIPTPPYRTLLADAPSADGPWRKRYDVAPFSPTAGTWYSRSASPGPVIRMGSSWWMFMSGAGLDAAGRYGRTIGLAKTSWLGAPWTVIQQLLPLSENVENAAVFHDRSTGLWWLLANRVGSQLGTDGHAYTDAIVAYWSTDWRRFDPAHKAVVLDASNSTWTRVVGMCSLVRVGGRLAMFYDGAADGSTDHMGRDLGLAWLELPLRVG
jgi:hypothetical protein